MKPFRNMPLALLSGISLVAIVYIAMNVAYFVVLDVETVKSSNAVAVVCILLVDFGHSSLCFAALQPGIHGLVFQFDSLSDRHSLHRIAQQ